LNQTIIGKQITDAFTSVFIGGIISVANRIYMFDSLGGKRGMCSIVQDVLHLK